jgi:hypothetical protein
MAKKKKKKTEAQVFAEFGVGKGDADAAMRKFIHGQRAINGKLYRAIELILDALPTEKSKTSIPDSAKLAKAKTENDGVPGPSPGCTGG